MRGDVHDVNLSSVATTDPTHGTERIHPDWVILGVPQLDGKVMVLASKTLTTAEMEIKYQEAKVTIQDFLVRSSADPRCTLKAVMKNFHIFVADTYEQAFNALFREWSADEPRTSPRPLPSAG